MTGRWILARIAFIGASLAYPPVWSQDAALGRDLFLRKCIGCHAFTCNKDGPKLAGLIGREVGTVADYSGYTQALKDARFKWTVEALDDFFAAPEALFPDSTMAGAGKIEVPEDRVNLIEFLRTEDPSVNLCNS